MNGDLWLMASKGITLLPNEAKRLADEYYALRDEVQALRAEYRRLQDLLTKHHTANEPDESRRR